jgi:hypothetical protein
MAGGASVTQGGPDSLFVWHHNVLLRQVQTRAELRLIVQSQNAKAAPRRPLRSSFWEALRPRGVRRPGALS